MKLSIIIVNYNTSDLIIECVRSITAQTKEVTFEIIVIDNKSPHDDPKRIVKAWPKIKLILNESNIGFGGANNVGIKKAIGEYILLLNSDTIILDGAIDKCIKYFDSIRSSDLNLGLIGCKLLYENGDTQKSVFFTGSGPVRYFIHSNPILSRLFKTKHPFFDYECDQPQEVYGISGAFMLFHREVFEYIKPFDPDIFMYCEETELCRNRVNKYFKIFYYPEATIVHLVGKSSVSNNLHSQSMLSYALTWYKKGTGSYIIYLISCLINIPSLLIAFIFAGKNGKNDFAKQLRGYISIFPYLFFDIPKYSRKWGGRPKPLKLKSIN